MCSDKQIIKDLYKAYIEDGVKKAKDKEFDDCELIFLKALSLDKKETLAYINLSNIYIVQNKIEKSVKLLMSYFTKNHFNEEIANHTARILFTFKQTKHLINLFKITKLNSKKNSHKKNYLYFIQGQYYEREEEYEKAKHAFNRSIECNKFYFDSYLKLLNLYEKTIDYLQFKKLLKVSFNIFNDVNQIRILLFYKSLSLFNEKKFYESQKIITNNNLYYELNNNNVYFIKLLDLEAKNNEKLKYYDLAFKKIEEKNNIITNLSESKRFDGKNIYSSIDKYKIFFNKKNVSYINSKLNYQNDNNLVFLIGFPRSGTTLLDSILRSHSCINVLEEKPFLLNLRHEFFKNNNNDLSSLLDISQKAKDNIRESYFKKIITSPEDNRKIIIDKFPLTIIELGFIKCIFPRAKIILALRHPCDVVLSCYFSSFKINDAMVNFLKWKDTIKFYNSVFNLFEFYNKELSLDLLTIKYEDVINDFKNKTKIMSNYLGLEYEESMENFFQTARNRSRISTPSYNQVINPLYTSSIGRWKNYSVARQSKIELNKWIKRFNY